MEAALISPGIQFFKKTRGMEEKQRTERRKRRRDGRRGIYIRSISLEIGFPSRGPALALCSYASYQILHFIPLPHGHHTRLLIKGKQISSISD